MYAFASFNQENVSMNGVSGWKPFLDWFLSSIYLPTYLLPVEVEADADRCLPRLAHVGNVTRVPLDGDGFGTAKLMKELC